MPDDFATAFTDPHDPASCEVPGCMHGKWAEQIEMMRRIDPATVELISTAAPLCKGKTLEHHDQLAFPADSYGRWRCTTCGTEGNVHEINERLIHLLPEIEQLKAAVYGCRPVILLPSDAKPGHVGDFMGCKVYRVQGIDKPMVALAGT